MTRVDKHFGNTHSGSTHSGNTHSGNTHIGNRHLIDLQGAKNITLQRSDEGTRKDLNEDSDSPIANGRSPKPPPVLTSASFSRSGRELVEKHRATLITKALFEDALPPIAKTESGATLYGPPGGHLSHAPPDRPLKIAILTSIRDVGLEEHVGQVVEPGNPDSYVKGTVETALEAVQDHRLGDYAEIVAIITDDLKRDLKKGDYVADPSQPGAWIFPRDIRNKNGELATSLTVNIPSSFRSLPMKDIEGRQTRKVEFESKLFKILEETGADILLSDHFLARIEYLIDPNYFKMLGRVLNTHPGIIRPDHPYTCLGKATYDHMRLHAQGLRRISDKSIVRVPEHDLAGASFHFITAGIDRGPVLCDAELTRISPRDSDITVARKLYETSKYHAFIEGVRHYASNIFPLFDRN